MHNKINDPEENNFANSEVKYNSNDNKLYLKILHLQRPGML